MIRHGDAVQAEPVRHQPELVAQQGRYLAAAACGGVLDPGGLHPQQAGAAVYAPEPGNGVGDPVRVARDVVVVYLDLSGEPLHRRGYRTELTDATLKETLAAAVVALSGWHRGAPFLDPLAGCWSEHLGVGKFGDAVFSEIHLPQGRELIDERHRVRLRNRNQVDVRSFTARVFGRPREALKHQCVTFFQIQGPVNPGVASVPSTTVSAVAL